MVRISSQTKFFLKNQPKGNIPKHIKNVLDFCSLTNVLGFSPKVKRAIKSIDFALINQYGDRSATGLKKKISKWLSIPVECISLSNGSDEMIDLLPRIFMNPNDVVISQAPTFFRVIESSLKIGIKPVLVTAEEKNRFRLNDAFIKKIISSIKKHNPKLVWLCTPCNPTGVTISLDNIRRIALSTKGIILVDEAYQELCDPENKQSAIQLLPKHKNILVLKSFSKGFGLAGIRIGFIVGSRNIIDIVEKVRLNFNISVFSQKIAEAALDNLSFLKKCSNFFKEERALLFSEIKKLTKIVIGADSKINVFILKHKTKDIFEELLQHGILTADFRQANGLEKKGYVRITIKARKENGILLKALREID